MKKPLWLSDKILTAVKERDRLKKELKKGRIQRMSFNEGGIRVCGIGLFLVWCCGNSYFKVWYCGFQSPSGVR